MICNKDTLSTIFGTSDIFNQFVYLPNIARINLSTNNSLFREGADGKMAKYFITENLLFKAMLTEDGKELGICAIVPLEEVVSVETRNAYSASMFVGHSY